MQQELVRSARIPLILQDRSDVVVRRAGMDHQRQPGQPRRPDVLRGSDACCCARGARL